MVILFAHAGETHTNTVETSTHVLQDWYIAIPLFFIILALVAYLTWLVSNRSKNVTLGVVTFSLLIIGLTGFAISPPVSIIAILLGLVFSLFAAYTSIIS